MIDWFTSLPWALLFLSILGISAVIGVVSLSLVRRWVARRYKRFPHQNEVTGVVHAGILIVYGLALALLAIAVWERYSEVSNIVSEESVDLASIWRDTGGYPEPLRSKLRAGLKSYTEFIIQDAFPMARKGKVHPGGVGFMDRFQLDLFMFEPSTEGQRAIHQETLRAYNKLILDRNKRIETVGGGLSAPMWTVVLFGALITLLSALLFEVHDVALHRVMVILLSCIMGLMIFVIAFFDRPYRGTHGIQPEAYELIYDHLMNH
jgi:hypothetical protein